MTHQPQLLRDEPIPYQAARDDERAEYLERLREKLKDPEFRAIEGFPIGEDEDILALSDPPYYTACPNPFLPEILARWQAERAQAREQLGLPDDSDDNGNGGEPVYHREPFAADVSEGKSGSIYNAHSYHTKVPFKAIMRFILHYTDPGDVVFDGFCGTGMTGVAAQLCGDRKAVESLGYRAKQDGIILNEKDLVLSHLGVRKTVQVDLCPAATFITYNYNVPVEVIASVREASRIIREAEEECGWMYKTLHSDGKTRGRIHYVVWSDVFRCPECGGEMVFWNVAVDKEKGKVRDPFPCPHCGVEQRKRSLDYAQEIVYDSVLGQTIRRVKQAPVLINYSVGSERFEKSPDDFDRRIIKRIEEADIPHWFPTDRMPAGDESRRNDDIGMTHIHHFYTRRNLWALAALWNRGTSSWFRWLVSSVMQRANRQHQIAISRVGGEKKNAGGKTAGHRRGTLYVPSNQIEFSVFELIKRRLRVLKQASSVVGTSFDAIIATQSSHQLTMSSASVDYVFVDPPFGANIMYSELNFLWEGWLRLFTNNQPEAVVNNMQRKRLLEYQHLMEQCFKEFYRVLKPGRWMTVEFHNSKNSVWNAIQEALLRGGFIIADVRTLDKKKKTHTQVTAAGSVNQDLIISAYKPRTGFERRFLEQAGGVEGAWDFVRQHLAQLPVVVELDGALEVVAERQAYLLYDRMVAFHVQRGFSVPLGAAEFYAGLKQRFPERDEMYFLPDQAAEYDRERMRATRVEQLALFVTDEKSAIQWLRRELDPEVGGAPQTYQDLQPKFLRELHQARHEALPELSDMLIQNFLKDERDRWYVPDPACQGDLEKLRERSLLREFGEYAQGKGRLRVFRTEAVRAGFKHAWHERDYRLIVKVAERLPPSVLQEDASLLMYYDNALMRAESEPEQGKLL